ncbi:Histidine kinase-%2C DNA gyrase B-%2C and HSP90-like ATPase [Mycobacterium tuberculosis]|nr:Histidine kinase-%2C DNA gyrase B-%2C and HSP90-like ATPase [Mycobacterium tuberculosis]
MSAVIEGTSAGPAALRRSLLATPEAVQQGRLIVESQALQWRLPQSTVDDAVLVASELLTNSVRATRGQAITLRLALVPGGLRVEVWDASPEEPRPSMPDLAMPAEPLPDDAPDPGGWGLGIIASLAEEHGCRPEHGGKSVWAVLPTSIRRSS